MKKQVQTAHGQTSQGLQILLQLRIALDEQTAVNKRRPRLVVSAKT